MPETAFDDARVAAELKTMPGWRLDAGAIARRYDTDGWPTTLMLVNMIGFLAEAADHHPDLAVSWGRVEVRLNTHSAGGITAMDFALAREIERAALWRPAAGDALRGTTRKWVRGG